MIRRLPAALALLVSLHSPLLAQPACAPETLAKAVDVYAAEPYGARAWRVLNGLGDPGLEPAYAGEDHWDGEKLWSELAAKILPDQPEAKEVGYDCRLSYPLAVVKERMATLGEQSPYVKQWMMVQAQVFKTCGNSPAAVALPPPLDGLDAKAAALQADDRAYQEATAAFYADKGKAAELFKAIGAGPSVHRAAARYNVANLLANGKDLAGARREAEAILADPSLAAVHGITRELLGYLANMEDTAAGWSGLITDTVAALKVPAAEIAASPEKSRAYARALYDIGYAGVGAKQDDWWIAGKLPENPTLSKALVDAARAEPMALWMMAGQTAQQNYDAAPWALAGAHWQTVMADWMGRAMALKPAGDGITGLARDDIDALTAGTDDAQRAALWGKARAAMQKAAASCGTAAETAAAGNLLWHATRLAALANHYDEAYAALAEVPFKGARAYYDLVLGKLAGNILATGTAEEGRRLRDRLLTPEFFAAIPENDREPMRRRYAAFMAWVAEDEAHWSRAALAVHPEPMAAPLLNLLPGKGLWAMAGDTTLAASDRALLARAAWTRDYAGGGKAAARLDDMLALNPELKAAYDKVAADYPKITAQHRLLLTILRNPRFGILLNISGWGDPINSKREKFDEIDLYDHNDKNWWCPLEPDRQLADVRAAYDSDAGRDRLAYAMEDTLKPFHDPAEVAKLDAAREGLLRAHPMVKAIDWAEVKRLAEMGSAPRTLSVAALDWAKASRGDDGAPEALALAVKTTRYGCNWHGRHGSYSRAAQELLQKRFRDTAWAKATPYWFDCQYQVWDKDFNKVEECKAKDWPKQAPLH